MKKNKEVETLRMISPLTRNPFLDVRKKRQQEIGIIIAIYILFFTIVAILLSEVWISNH